MKRSREIRPEWDKNEGGSARKLLRFLVRHGEKIVAGVLVIGAIWLALNVLNYQPLPWKPSELEEMADHTEESIRNNELVLEDNEIRFFNYAASAEQIREKVPLVPYRGDTAWHPTLRPVQQPRGGFEILTAKSLNAKAVRRTNRTALGGLAEQWQRPALPETIGDNQPPAQNDSAIWVNLYGTIPVWEQWDIFQQILSSTDPADRPEYVYYELDKAEIKLNEVSAWQPVFVFSTEEYPVDRLIPFGQQQDALQGQDLLLFSDFDVEPVKTYAYRIRLYVRNPNYNLQETSVQTGVDTQNRFVRSDWSAFTRVYVPDRTLVQLRSLPPTDDVFFPRQTARPIRGILALDYFDIEQGLSLPLVEMTGVLRGTLGNMSKEDANRYINRGNIGEVVVNYPEAGLRSNICVMDFSGGRRLRKRTTREAQASPDLFVPGRALLLMPDGSIQITSTEPELFR